MRMRSQRVALALVGATLAAGCTPVCDEAGLRRAAATFIDADPGERQDGFAALVDACPSLPRALAESLIAERPPPATAQRLHNDRTEDPAWRELLARTCPGAPQPGDRPLALEDLDHAVRWVCELDRRGLLAPDDVVAGRDVIVFMLYDWLVAGRVDRGLASEVARPLLTAHSLRKWDLRPARGTIDLPPRGGPEIRVSASAVTVDAAVVPLERGRPGPGQFVDHVAAALRPALAARAADERAWAESEGRRWNPQAPLLVARDTPFSTLADVMFTAAAAGFGDFELIVDDGEELRGQPLAVPLEWLGPLPELMHRPLEVLFFVHRDGVEARVAGELKRRFTRPPSCAPGAAVCHDLAGIAAFAAELQAQFPMENVVVFRVDGDVELQTLVSLIDTVRGEGCALRDVYKGGPIPSQCRLWLPVVDSEPPRVRDAVTPGV